MLRCQRPPVSLRRFLFQIQLCLTGGAGVRVQPHDLTPPTMTPTRHPDPLIQARRCRSSWDVGAGGGEDSCEVRDLQPGGGFQNKQEQQT